MSQSVIPWCDAAFEVRVRPIVMDAKWLKVVYGLVEWSDKHLEQKWKHLAISTENNASVASIDPSWVLDRHGCLSPCTWQSGSEPPVRLDTRLLAAVREGVYGGTVLKHHRGVWKDAWNIVWWSQVSDGRTLSNLPRVGANAEIVITTVKGGIGCADRAFERLCRHFASCNCVASATIECVDTRKGTFFERHSAARVNLANEMGFRSWRENSPALECFSPWMFLGRELVAKVGERGGLVERLASGPAKSCVTRDAATAMISELPGGCLLIRTCSLIDLCGSDPRGAVIKVPDRAKRALARVIRESGLIIKSKWGVVDGE